jgi:hypothetical protein
VKILDPRLRGDDEKTLVTPFHRHHPAQASVIPAQAATCAGMTGKLSMAPFFALRAPGEGEKIFNSRS